MCRYYIAATTVNYTSNLPHGQGSLLSTRTWISALVVDEVGEELFVVSSLWHCALLRVLLECVHVLGEQFLLRHCALGLPYAL